VGYDLLDTLETDGHRHDISVVQAKNGPKVKMGDRVTGLSVFAALSDVSARLSWMDAAGIDRQLLSGWMDLAAYHLPPQAALWLARAQNDSLARLVDRHPDRFAASATVPLQAPEDAATELRRCVEELGHCAVQIGARIEQTALDDPSLDPFWAEAQRLGVCVIVHPVDLEAPERLRRLFLQILVGNPADTTFAAAALLLGGVLERFSSLCILLVHGGGFLPYQIGRLELAQSRAPDAAKPKSTTPPTSLLSQIYCDTVTHDSRALSYLADVIGIDHLVIGSDYPFPMRDETPKAAIEQAIEDAEAKTLVYGATAHRLLTPQANPAMNP
jgi:aminocarboxymuconate-semialdehyde decarboxylase